jgi:hypothetical protein
MHCAYPLGLLFLRHLPAPILAARYGSRIAAAALVLGLVPLTATPPAEAAGGPVKSAHGLLEPTGLHNR